jgi:uncharacterized protein (TIGR02271 family)
MTQTVIGIFNNTSDAQNAVEALLDNGFTEGNVDLSANNSTMSSRDATANDNDNESGISKFFKNLFGGDDESDRYTKAAERGSVVTVHTQTSEEAQQASELLDRYGAIDINDDDQDTNYESGTRSSEDINAEEGQTVSVIEENLQVGKRDTETGGVRLKSRIVEKPVEENLRLREEYVRVERKQVDRAATDADLENAEDVNIELIEHAEVPVVSKEARVVEEISIGKDVKHRDETVKDTVRKTEVDIEEIDTSKKNGF